MLPIRKQITTKTNIKCPYTMAPTRIVVHNTANDASAANEANYMCNNDLEKSTHYFVDEKEVWQSVREVDIAWHCGTKGTYFHPYCRNANSIGIELCSRMKNGKYYFQPGTVENAVQLVRMLMQKYDIAPDHVVRHYDVTHKNCPAPFVENAAAWQDFKRRLTEEVDDMTADEVKNLIAQSKTVYSTIASVPEWGRATVEKLERKGWIKGEGGSAGLNLPEEMLRVLVINDRAGIYGD